MADQDLEREQAVKRLRAKREFRNHVTMYVVVNIGLVVIWALTSRDYFWPIWPMLGWGIGIVAHGWAVFGQRSISEADIQAEIERSRRKGA